MPSSGQPLLPGNQQQDGRILSLSCLGWTLGGIYSWKGWSGIERAAQRDGGVPFPGGVQGRTERGIQCSGLMIRRGWVTG